ncbi:hypothetical protein A6122_2053 [Rathayibacter tritici]|uniref:Uncharacterized protein n=1 Tax=Rathayibacter tritici TaxID=33888 RepID=A0A160KUC5_9MICO|nr:hypothetical protein A6122_2053 [Rathayibacter tritici]
MKSRVREALRWSPGELVALVHEVEMLDVEGGAWSRGGLGQSLWSIMAVDPLLQGSLERAVKLAVIERRIDAAVRMLICFQWLAANPLDELTKLLQATPELSGHETVNELLNLIELHGRVDIY